MCIYIYIYIHNKAQRFLLPLRTVSAPPCLDDPVR